MDQLEPTWGVHSHVISTVQSRAMQLDALDSTHPVEVDVTHPNEINEIFDDISYRKGASVLFMLSVSVSTTAHPFF